MQIPESITELISDHGGLHQGSVKSFPHVEIDRYAQPKVIHTKGLTREEIAETS